MGQWKILVGSEKRMIKPVGKDTQEREAIYYQIITCDNYGFLVCDYEIIPEEKVRYTSTGGLPINVLEIDGQFYETRTDKKFMTNFNDIIDVYIRNWKQPNPNYDITDVKLAIKYFKELIELKNELLMLKA
jgi:hypothetical protein